MKTENEISLGGYRHISPSSILMLKADTNYTITYLIDGSHFLSATTLGVLEERLKNFNFFRTHRSTIVNLQYVNKIEEQDHLNFKDEIKPLCDQSIPIARRKLSDFLRKIEAEA
jgi:DNA-binding LytR/AlgR family response regulator